MVPVPELKGWARMIEVLGAERDGASSGLRLVEDDDHSLVTAFGEIDLTVRHVAHDLCQVVSERGLPLVIDAADVTFIDSAGMSVLVRLARDAEANGYPVVLRRAPWMLKELLTITGLDRLLPFDDEPSPERPAAAPAVTPDA
jgi:anti-anti-sigma factor